MYVDITTTDDRFYENLWIDTDFDGIMRRINSRKFVEFQHETYGGTFHSIAINTDFIVSLNEFAAVESSEPKQSDGE